MPASSAAPSDIESSDGAGVPKPARRWANRNRPQAIILTKKTVCQKASQAWLCTYATSMMRYALSVLFCLAKSTYRWLNLRPAVQKITTGLRHSSRTLFSYSKPFIEKIDKQLWILPPHNLQRSAEIRTLPAAKLNVCLSIYFAAHVLQPTMVDKYTSLYRMMSSVNTPDGGEFEPLGPRFVSHNSSKWGLNINLPKALVRTF